MPGLFLNKKLNILLLTQEDVYDFLGKRSSNT
jgi:hypothetical protein